MVLSGSGGEWQTWPMKSDTPSYHGYRFPPEIISHAVWVSSAKKKIATRCGQNREGDAREIGLEALLMS